jgi:diguanylate cyclase (GGDEF)-like protein
VTVVDADVVEKVAVEETYVDPVRSAFNTAAQLLDAGRASLLIRDSQEDMFSMVAAIDIDPQLVSSIRVRSGEGVAGVTAQRGIGMLGIVGDETFLSVPVLTDRGVEGVLNMTKPKSGHYTTLDLVRATRAAAHIGKLIEYDRTVARDALTGFHNRRAFDDILEREVSRSDRLGRSFAVVFVDLDSLKDINDRFGHSEGDAAIKAVADAVQHVLRPYDFAARYGGDEFVFLLPDIGESYEASSSILSRLEEAIDTLSKNSSFPISASVGVAWWPKDGRTAADVVGVADSRMYDQKRRKTAAVRQVGDWARTSSE